MTVIPNTTRGAVRMTCVVLFCFVLFYYDSYRNLQFPTIKLAKVSKTCFPWHRGKRSALIWLCIAHHMSINFFPTLSGQFLTHSRGRVIRRSFFSHVLCISHHIWKNSISCRQFTWIILRTLISPVFRPGSIHLICFPSPVPLSRLTPFCSI